MYNTSRTFDTYIEAADYINDQVKVFNKLLPMQINIYDEFDMSTRAWKKIVSITLAEARGRDVRQTRGNEFKSTQG